MPAAAERAAPGAAAPRRWCERCRARRCRGGARGGSARGSLGSPRAVSALGYRPQSLPALQPARGIDGPLGVRGPGGQGAARGGLAGGTRARQQPQQKGIAAPSPAPPLAFCALLPSALLSLGSPHRRQPSWLFWAMLAARRAAVRSLRWQESSPLLPGVKTLPLPPFLPPSHRSPQAHLEASPAGIEVFTFLWV